MLPVFYINLARRTDRREFMEGQFDALGIEAVRVDAITPASMPAALPDRHNRHSPVELACNLSHQSIWAAFLAGTAPAAVVFEDDGRLSRRLPALLAALADGLPDGIDLLKLETCGHGTRLSQRREVRIGAFEARRLVGSHFGTCGYVISRKAAELALADAALNDALIDEYLFTRNGPMIYRARVYQVAPALSRQLAGDPGRRGEPLATSDLAPPRKVVMDKRGSGRKRWLHLRQNARAGLLDALYFHRDWRGLLGPRQPIPFADD